MILSITLSICVSFVGLSLGEDVDVCTEYTNISSCVYEAGSNSSDLECIWCTDRESDISSCVGVDNFEDLIDSNLTILDYNFSCTNTTKEDLLFLEDLLGDFATEGGTAVLLDVILLPPVLLISFYIFIIVTFILFCVLPCLSYYLCCSVIHLCEHTEKYEYALDWLTKMSDAFGENIELIIRIVYGIGATFLCPVLPLMAVGGALTKYIKIPQLIYLNISKVFKDSDDDAFEHIAITYGVLISFWTICGILFFFAFGCALSNINHDGILLFEYLAMAWYYIGYYTFICGSAIIACGVILYYLFLFLWPCLDDCSCKLACYDMDKSDWYVFWVATVFGIAQLIVFVLLTSLGWDEGMGRIFIGLTFYGAFFVYTNIPQMFYDFHRGENAGQITPFMMHVTVVLAYGALNEFG